MAVATLPFLFNTSYTIEGGNLTSTLAGEFSFSLALTADCSSSACSRTRSEPAGSVGWRPSCTG